MLWLSVVAAILTLWMIDRSRLQRQLDVRTGMRTNSWSIDQLCGPPDTQGFGDISTAWASRSPDADREWVIVEFSSTVQPKSLLIIETYHPGAVAEVWSVAANAEETLLWRGKDPLWGTAAGRGTAIIPLAADTRLRRFKIVIDSTLVPGWNEIDAVGLEDAEGNVQWARRAWASSSYGTNREPPTWYWP